MHAFLVVDLAACPADFSSSPVLNTVFDAYMRLLCSDRLLDVNFAARRCLLHLLKPPVPKSTKPAPPGLCEVDDPLRLPISSSNPSSSENLATPPPSDPFFFNEDEEPEPKVRPGLLELRKCLLEKFAQSIDASVLGSFSRQSDKSGLRLVAFFQCLLNLLSDLSANDKQLLDSIIQSLLNILGSFKRLANRLSGLDDPVAIAAAVEGGEDKEPPIYVRTESHELQLV